MIIGEGEGMRNTNRTQEAIDIPGHEKIRAAVTDQRDMISNLQDLVDQIRGPKPKATADNVPEPSMESVSDVLMHGGERIRANTDRLAGLISELKDAIF